MPRRGAATAEIEQRSDAEQGTVDLDRSRHDQYRVLEVRLPLEIRPRCRAITDDLSSGKPGMRLNFREALE